jgi:type III restriction enzyme
MLNPDFKELWSKISKKTKYAVNIDTENLIENATKSLDAINIKKIDVKITRANVEMKNGQIRSPIISGEESQEIDLSLQIPNLLDAISEDTNLTRETIYKIITKSKNFNHIFNNPREYIDSTDKRIKASLTDYLVNGIKYMEIGKYWEMSLFQNLESYEEYIYPLTNDNSIYEGVIFDAEKEKTFAEKLNDDPRIKLFIKLPDWFTVETPLGTYNPDWAIVMEGQDISGKKKPKVYLIRETKFVESLDNLRPSERNKISCAKEHFKTINVDFDVVKSYDELTG